MSPEPEPRRHHYVPRCWLAGFTEGGARDGRLWVTDLSRRRQWPSTPNNAGHIRDFYRLADPAPDPVVIERFFSVLEDQVAPLLRSIDQERRPPNIDELDVLLRFMAYQWVRVPRFRPFVFEVMDRIVRERLATELRSRETWLAAVAEAGLDPNAPGAEYEGMKRFFESGEWNVTVETDWYMHKAFEGAERILDRLRERYWGSSFTDQGRLIASDNPVVMDGERGMIRLSECGVRAPSAKPPRRPNWHVGTKTAARREFQLFRADEYNDASPRGCQSFLAYPGFQLARREPKPPD